MEVELAPEKETFMQRMIRLRGQYITDRQFTLILSFLVGLFAAIAAFGVCCEKYCRNGAIFIFPAEKYPAGCRFLWFAGKNSCPAGRFVV